MKFTLKSYCICNIFLSTNAVTAQNLIPNSGFEQYHFLPTEPGEWCAVKSWNNLTNVCGYDTPYGSPDYFHSYAEYPVSLPNNAFATVIPHKGKGIMGLVAWGEILPNFREYISTKLLEPMEIGAFYELTFYTSNGENDFIESGYGTKNIGIHFTKESLEQVNSDPLILTPHLEATEILYSNNWVQNTFSFMADDNYQYITLGNFRDDANTTVQQFDNSSYNIAYYFFDNICLIKTGNDCTIEIPSTPEICNNGIDDDGDLLIDINDEDCSCSNIYSLIPDYSFEDTLCCPNALEQLSCLQSWEQASDNAPDYFHTCGKLVYEELPRPPAPIISRNGFIGFSNGGEAGNFNKEYAGICLDNPLTANTIFLFECKVGFGLQRGLSARSSSPFELCIYGHPSCGGLPFEGSSCPTDSNTPGWIKLGSAMVSGQNEWVQVQLSCTPDIDIYALAIGPNCEPGTPEEKKNYYYLDEVVAYPENNAPLISGSAGVPCLENVELSAPFFEQTDYQWYKDGVAIPGAENSVYTIPPGNDAVGSYQVMFQTDEGCHLSTPYRIDDLPEALLPDTLRLCTDSPVTIGQLNYGTSFLWNTGDTSQTLFITEPGNYSVTVTNACGSATDEVFIYGEDVISTCVFVVPNAFTPDGDGHNDVFRALTECCLTKYNLQVFSRWGNLVFQSDDVSNGWNGIYKGAPLPTDVYIWKASWSVALDGQEKTFSKAGDVLLLR